MRIRALLFAALITASVLLVPGPAVAQAAGGTIYFDSNIVSQVGPPDAEDCGFVNHYGATLTQPAAGQAYSGLSVIGSACAFYFEYVATAPFTITGDLAVNYLIGCTAASPIIEVDAEVYVGEDAIANEADGYVFFLPPTACAAGTPIQVTVPIVGAGGTEVGAGQVLAVRAIVFGTDPPNNPGNAGNTFVITGAATSSLTGPGLPGGVVPVGTERLGLGAATKVLKGAAGSSVIYNLTVSNLGIATNFTLGTEGLPNGYSAAFNPLSGDLAANNGTAKSFLKITIPGTATPGTFPFKAKVTGGAGTNATLDLKIEVTKATGPGQATTGPSSSSDLGEFTNTDDSGTKAAPGIEFLVNIVAVGLLVVALRRRVQ